MNLLNVENISKSYNENKLLKNISLGINEGDKIGLIGINGTGKTTLLKIIAGIEEADEGRIVKGSAVRIGYLPQKIAFDPNATVEEQVFRGNSKNMVLLRKYEEAINNPNTPSEEIVRLTHQMDAMDVWNLENEAKAVLTKLGITDFKAKVGDLSGGQRKRIALASALINPSELLILDEPTNHLDNDTIEWLEEYLGKRKGALLMITHDRYFLDMVVNKIVELDGGNLYSYEGNYNSYLEKKLEREEMEVASEKKRRSLLRKELAWMKQGAKARSTKQKARIDRFNELNERVTNLLPDENLEISVGNRRLGKKVIELNHVSKSYDGKKIIDDFDYIVLRDDRIGILGPNGSGKSTLINIMAGNIEPDAGSVEIGDTVKIGLYSQETHHIDDSLRVIDYIKEGSDNITTAEGVKISASQMLEKFLFPPYVQWTPIAKLSGGEKRRLHLLRVLMEEPNVLLLDEPTNDLDIETLTILEDYLEEFLGAVIVVSHDRYFLDKLAEKVFVFEGEGKIVQYTGNYWYYKKNILEKKQEIKKEVEKPAKKEKPKRENKLKLTFKEQKEYEEIDDIISDLEDKIHEVEIKMEEASTDYVALEELLQEKEKLKFELEKKMDRWVYLNELVEKIKIGDGGEK
ncbi:ABC-F family ATP-binding cassette domain-containing protein [Anaerosalibacter sp. Marseille-P3206]|uniref:ABC-F family ATP-binding cassette domain-containing protein n=1 Tax=Anaerosalibacter sp. Marseille-P3206 TaxID=1871005 RepID=UPI000985E9B3|nr:ABC-F family ATP-binding cassette domain-containing protein [Anaerosalibacter sp. Marseille-P3206]